MADHVENSAVRNQAGSAGYPDDPRPLWTQLGTIQEKLKQLEKDHEEQRKRLDTVEEKMDQVDAHLKAAEYRGERIDEALAGQQMLLERLATLEHRSVLAIANTLNQLTALEGKLSQR
ncbi:hypothetical protein LTR37_009405 [Vermiconidia calcicola]|uniref:Uncharacterized protein n=1 Tax=Vermiconidia calcicola TaxID=1690605 RepID=A0ACC3N995_9PEZI|nr:hypothetical protein LTR37_009405 [Vermiconidia calcicola]